MKRIFISSLALLLCAALLFVVAPAEVSAATIAKGSYGGPTTSWEVSSDGTLTLSGSGYMQSLSTAYPWMQYADKITKVVVKEGLTTIASNAFEQMDRIASVQFPSTLTHIGNGAFRACTGLKSITIPANVSLLGEEVFLNALHCER